jgi:hypothetical protein
VGAGGTILLSGEHGLEQRMHLKAEGVSFARLKVNMSLHRHSFFAAQTEKKKTARKSGSKKNPGS